MNSRSTGINLLITAALEFQFQPQFVYFSNPSLTLAAPQFIAHVGACNVTKVSGVGVTTSFSTSLIVCPNLVQFVLKFACLFFRQGNLRNETEVGCCFYSSLKDLYQKC